MYLRSACTVNLSDCEGTTVNTHLSAAIRFQRIRQVNRIFIGTCTLY